jgi:hypothetical protein
MRLMKMLGLAAVAALASMAFIASSASADTLCEQNVGELNECAAAQRALVNKKIAGLATAAKLLGENLATLLTCNSETLGEITRTGGNLPVLGTITKLLFTNCEGPCTKAHGINLPYTTEANATSLHALFSSAANNPGALIEGCPFGVTCKYESASKPVLLKATDDTLVAFEIKLSLKNPGLCSIFGSVGEWDATYLVTLDPKVGEHITPLYLVDKP